ncbi:hypothetical protein P8452_38107 [Trifolium repens]|nr:hypothetical protein P8452_38107 [Trifolium repens]
MLHPGQFYNIPSWFIKSLHTQWYKGRAPLFAPPPPRLNLHPREKRQKWRRTVLDGGKCVRTKEDIGVVRQRPFVSSLRRRPIV